VNFYASANTDLDTGLDFAALRAVEDNDVQVLVFGFESCEAALRVNYNPFFSDASGLSLASSLRTAERALVHLSAQETPSDRVARGRYPA
jgi:hypothetical protein